MRSSTAVCFSEGTAWHFPGYAISVIYTDPDHRQDPDALLGSRLGFHNFQTAIGIIDDMTFMQEP